MSSVVHTGDFDHIKATYDQLLGWIEANGYRLSVPIREVYAG